MNPALTEALSLLAAIVNRSGRVENTTCDMKITTVPVALLREARTFLIELADTEYTTNEIRNASKRIWD